MEQNESPRFRFTFWNTVEDQVSFLVYYSKHTKHGRKPLYIFIAGSVIFLLFAAKELRDAIQNYRYYGWYNWVDFIPCVIFFIMAVLYLYLLSGSRLKRRYTRMLNKRFRESNITMPREETLTFGEDTVTAEMPDGSSEFRYDSLKYVRDTGDLILIFSSVSSALLIPVRDIPEGQKDEFLAFLHEKITENPTKL